jgi:hypothetical protein
LNQSTRKTEHGTPITSMESDDDKTERVWHQGVVLRHAVPCFLFFPATCFQRLYSARCIGKTL